MLTLAVLLLFVGGALLAWVIHSWIRLDQEERIQQALVIREPVVVGQRPRSLPKIAVGGRTYQVVEVGTADEIVEPCPWCLRVPMQDEGIARCNNLHCRRVAHKRCNDNNGGCGGVCSVLGR